MTTRLDQLRRKRAQDMAALIDAQHPMPSTRVFGPEVRAPEADLLACAARELAWLQEMVGLQQHPPVRSPHLPRLAGGVVTPFEPSVLTVIYRARYHLAACASAESSPRQIHVLYTAARMGILPDACE